MAPQWMLWMLLLKFSSSEEIKSDTAGKSSSDGTYHQDTLPYTLVTDVTPNSLLLFAREEGHQIDPFQPVCKDGNEICPTEKYLTGATAEYSETINIPIRRMNMTEKSFKSLDIQPTRDLSALSTDAASLSQMLGGVDRPELRERNQVLAYDAGYSQQAGLRDQLILRHLQQEVHINTTQDVMKKVSESSMCRGYFFLLDNPDALLTYISNYHGSWNDHGSDRTRRSPVNTGAGGTYCDNCSLPLSLAIKADEDLTLVDLVSYLISLTSGRQFYLVYDDLIPGVEGVVRTFQKVMGDTILLPYDPNILLLTEVLRSNYHVQPMRNVFILCSATHLLNLFQQVKDKVLESPTIQWFVIVDKDLTEDLQVVLREGTQVALVQRLTRQMTQLYSSGVDLDGQIRFHQVGWWSVSGTWRTRINQVKGGLVPDLQQLYSDFQGRQLVVATVHDWPFFKVETLKNGTVIPIAGIDLNVINALSEKLNFTYQLVLPPDGEYGGPKPDGTITGVVGMVARHEAHATICELTITLIRETVVDFTLPYYLESMTLVSPAPKEKNRSFAILSPFTVEVWLSICLVTALVGPLLYMVARLLVVYLGEEDSVHYSLQSFSFNMYRNLMLQGNLIDSHRWSLRFIFLCWYLFCFYIYAVYSGTLTAALAVIAYEKPIDSLYDLAQAHRDGYTIGTVRGTNYEATFKRAESGIYQEVWQLFNHEDRNKSFVATTEIGLKMITKQKFVLINAQLNSRLKATQQGRKKFHMARDTFLPQGYGIACSSGSPFSGIFSSVLIRMTEVGLVSKWADVEVNKVFQYMSPSSDPGPTAITLQHLQADFLILVLGFAISAIVLIAEIIANRC